MLENLRLTLLFSSTKKQLHLAKHFSEKAAVSARQEFDKKTSHVNTTARTRNRNQQTASSIIQKKQISVKEFPLSYPDFLPSPIWNRRDPLYEKLMNADMLERRMKIDIPEFYVGSILAVTLSDPNTPTRQTRFVGICIRRDKEALKHNFTLRNLIDGLGVEIMYEIYNPTIIKIETLVLEKRLDEDLTYLVDALPHYSTFPFNMEPTAHVPGKPVPLNPIKVKLKPPPWTRPWFQYDVNGIEDSWTEATPWFKRKFLARKDLHSFKKYDIIRHYRDFSQELEHDLEVQKRILEFEKEYPQRMKEKSSKKLLKSAAKDMHEISYNISSKAAANDWPRNF